MHATIRVMCITVLLLVATILVAIVVRTQRGHQDPAIDVAAMAAALPSPPVAPPFVYDIHETKETIHMFGPQIQLEIETTNDVAKTATEEPFGHGIATKPN